MAALSSITFANLNQPAKGNLVVLCNNNGEFANSIDAALAKSLKAIIKIADFDGKAMAVLETINPGGANLSRVVILGVGDTGKPGNHDWLRLGGKAFKAAGGFGSATIMLDMPGKNPADTISAENAADFAMGAKLAAYKFDAYKSKNQKEKPALKMTISLNGATAARKAWKPASGVADGVILARNLVNEPANILTPLEFSIRVRALTKLGVEVEILDEKKMKKLGMRTLLGVSQGSHLPPFMAVMQWNGAKQNDQPVAFVGKGVTFDTGGISIKPAGGMEDMKGDMGGAAAVTGLMHALAARKAKANVVGIIGLVENAVDGKAQRPGDIVKSMSGKTIEVLNTDAEGRLVLADALWYCQQRFKPKFMVNLATLTGAILVALGHHHAGLFSNNDQLAERLYEAGQSTKEKVWRMPMGDEYDKLIDSKNADMKNIGGRLAGSITAAQFLQKFVNNVPWAHLDVAGTAMGSPQTEINRSWGSGFGVRLLDRLVRDHYEN